MRDCPHCGKQLQDSTVHCNACGTLVSGESNEPESEWDRYIAKLEALSPAERAQEIKRLTTTQQVHLISRLASTSTGETAAHRESRWQAYISYYSQLGPFSQLRAWHALTPKQRETLASKYNIFPPVNLQDYGKNILEVAKVVGCIIGLLLLFRVFYWIPQEYIYESGDLSPVESVRSWIMALTAINGVLVYWLLFRWGKCKGCDESRRRLSSFSENRIDQEIPDRENQSKPRFEPKAPLSIQAAKVFIGIVIFLGAFGGLANLVSGLDYTELRVLASGFLVFGIVLGRAVYKQVQDCPGCKRLEKLL